MSAGGSLRAETGSERELGAQGRLRIHTILVPTDFSPHADAALAWALQLAPALAAQIHVLHAYCVDAPALSGEPCALTPAFMEKLRATAQARLAPLERRVMDAGVRCALELSAQDPTRAVLTAATMLPADLIVMGTRGATGDRALFVGSVAQRMLSLAPCPVLVVRAPGH